MRKSRLTRAKMISDMHDVALSSGEPIAKMTFFHDEEHGEGLFAAFKTLMLIHDGDFVRDAQTRDLFLPKAVRDDDVEPEM